jgi:hypothetical protein
MKLFNSKQILLLILFHDAEKTCRQYPIALRKAKNKKRITELKCVLTIRSISTELLSKLNWGFVVMKEGQVCNKTYPGNFGSIMLNFFVKLKQYSILFLGNKVCHC